MGKQRIITIERETGSGGKRIAEELAKKQGMPLYDKNIVAEIEREKNLSAGKLAPWDEKPRNPWLTRRVKGFSNSMEENLANMQFEFLRRKAESGESFVVLGRCAKSVLHMHPIISVFLYGNEEDKMKNVMKRYNIGKEEALKKIREQDSQKKRYHAQHSNTRWGDPKGYDLCVNTSLLGIDKTVDLLHMYCRKDA